jgi:hypothetical protein
MHSYACAGSCETGSCADGMESCAGLGVSCAGAGACVACGSRSVVLGGWVLGKLFVGGD